MSALSGIFVFSITYDVLVDDVHLVYDDGQTPAASNEARGCCERLSFEHELDYRGMRELHFRVAVRAPRASLPRKVRRISL